jgi:hypothetical protein
MPAGADHPPAWLARDVERRRVQGKQSPDDSTGRANLVLVEPLGRQAQAVGAQRVDDQARHRPADAIGSAGMSARAAGLISLRPVSGPACA